MIVDMYTQDKITRGGEVMAAGRFTSPGGSFYLFIAPKTENVDSVAAVTARLIYNNEDAPVPLTAGVWNPVVFSAVEVTQDLLSSFRVFWGEEGV